MLGERGKVLQRGAPPLIDGLVGIADRSHREAPAEDASQQLPLAGIGVLILVEERYPVPVSHPGGNVGVACHQLVGQTDEVRIVEDVQPPFLGVVAGQRGGDLPASGPRFVAVPNRQQVVGDIEVVSEVGSQLLQLVHHAGRGDVQRLVATESFHQELAGEGGGDDGAGALHADEGAELLQQTGGKAVVGVDLYFPARLHAALQGDPDPVGELLSGLVGEGDAEHLFRLHALALDQVDDPQGQRARLPGSGAGRDSHRSQRVAEDRLLLAGGGERHLTNASRPSGHAGHTSFTAHRSHALPGRGVQSSARIARDTSRMRPATSSRREVSKGTHFCRCVENGYQNSASTGSP